MTVPTSRIRTNRWWIITVVIAIALLGLNRYRHAQLHNAECRP